MAGRTICNQISITIFTTGLVIACIRTKVIYQQLKLFIRNLSYLCVVIFKMSFVNILDSRPSFHKMFLLFPFSYHICPGFSSATTGTVEPLLTRCLARSETSWQRMGQVIEAALRKRSQGKKDVLRGKQFERKLSSTTFH